MVKGCDDVIFPIHQATHNRRLALIDSGCSTTCVSDISMFSHLRDAAHSVTTADGSINIDYQGPIGPYSEVFHIPTLNSDLISVGDLDQLGVVMHVEKGIMTGHIGDREVLHCTKDQNLWHVDFNELSSKIMKELHPEEIQEMWWLCQEERVCPAVSQQTSPKAPTKIQLNLRKWHNRLAHRGETSMISDINSGKLSLGDPMTKLSRTRDLLERECNYCRQMKSTRLPRPSRAPAKKDTRTRSYKKEEADMKTADTTPQENTLVQGFSDSYVSTDTTGPYTEPSWKHEYVGNHNMLLMGSKWVTIYGYKKKSQAPSNLKHFIEHDAKILNKEILHYHSDGAPELSGVKVRDYLSSKGIASTKSTAYVPQENSYIERHFRSEFEGASTMLLAARFIPKKFWYEAKLAYTFIYNRMPTMTSKGRMSPFENIHGHPPDLTTLRIWGCKAWVNIPIPLRSKTFDPRAETGYLVGYSEHQQGAYRIWIPKWDTIIVSRDVRFDEEIPSGDIDHLKDDYWHEARLARTRHDEGVIREVDDFQYLIGQTFYDPDESQWFRVTQVTANRKNDIIAYVTDYDPKADGQSVGSDGKASDIGRNGNTPSDETEATVKRASYSYHVAEVEKMILGSFLSALEEDDTAMATKTVTRNVSWGVTEENRTGREQMDYPMHRNPIPGNTKSVSVEHTIDLATKQILSNSKIMKKSTVEKTTSAVLTLVGETEAGLAKLDYAFAVNFVDSPEPKTYAEAIHGAEKDKWILSIAEEISNLERRGVVEQVPSTGRNEVSVKYVFKKKTKHGEVYKYKTRIVARGFSQIEGVDYNETYSPVARMNTMRVFVKMSIDRGFKLLTFDVEAAFLNAPLQEEIYIQAPDGWNVKAGHSLKLLKAIYGLKQSAREWYHCFRDFLLEREYKPLVSDPCLFVNKDITVMILVYVDDVIVACKNSQDFEDLKRDANERFGVGDNGPFDWYLGLAIEDNGETLFMHQKDYVDKMLEKYSIDGSHIEATPMIDKYVIVKDVEDELFEQFDIRGKIGSLMYLAVCSRPDIAFAVCYLARFTVHPSSKVCAGINRIFRYLAGSRDLGINFERESNSELVIYCDADYGADVNDGKSTTGVLAKLGSTNIGWYSSKQTTVAQSTTDAESIALNFGAKEAIWIRGLLVELGINLKGPTRLLTDSQPALQLLLSKMLHKRTKHIMLKIAYIINEIEEGSVLPERVSTLENLSDGMTKSQVKSLFLDHVLRLHMKRVKLRQERFLNGPNNM